MSIRITGLSENTAGGTLLVEGLDASERKA